jgi:uncharacterized protein
MILSEAKNSDAYQIRAYGPGFVTVNNDVHHQSLIISKDTLLLNWRPKSLPDLTPEDFASVLALKPELLILGTGQDFKLPQPQQLRLLHQAGIKVECMSTAAACRTYVVLSSEGRNVAAALIVAS